MKTLVRGTFAAEDQAAQAVSKLIKSCIPLDLVRTIFPTARKRHAAPRPASSQGGIMVAVKASQYVAQQLAIKILRDHGAHDIECVSPRRRAKQGVRIRVAVRNQHAPVPA